MSIKVGWYLFVALAGIIVLLAVLVDQGSKAPPAPETKTQCVYTPADGYTCVQVRK